MSRYRAKSWRTFDPSAPVAVLPAPRLSAVPRVRILGLDPGSRRTGFGLVDCDGGGSIHVAHGCIAGTGATLSERLRAVFEGVRDLLDQHRPDEVAIERVFVNRNIDSALKLGHARGAALCAVPRAVPVFEYSPRAIKLAVVGFGGAEKLQVAQMVRTLLNLQTRIGADAADALAVAICHAHSRGVHALTRPRGAARQ